MNQSKPLKNMDQTSFAKELNSLFPTFLLLLLPLIFIILKHICLPFSKQKPLPPGPKPWPIIGNFLHLAGKTPHITMTQLAKIHGPLISLRLGAQLFIVGSSKMAAIEILKTNDRFLSGRFLSKMSPFESNVINRIGIISAPKLTGGWKSLRALCRNELFSAKAIESQAVLREKKVGMMVEFLGTKEGQVISIGEVVFTTVFNILSNLFFSKDFIDFEDNGEANRMKCLVRKMAELGATPYLADFYPIFTGLDPQGLKRKLSECVEEMFAIWGVYVKKRRDSYIDDESKRDFLDVFLANGFDDLQINWLLLELFSAGTETTTTTIEWLMTELLKNKEIMRRVKEELRRESEGSPFDEFHVSQLPYLNGCVKETLRLHPPAPFLIPHYALGTCEVMDYMIPKDCRVIVNVWAIGRDPSVWEDPLSFKPERFLGSNLDFNGQHFEFLPFGAGRRICPGLPMATRKVHLIVATLIDRFGWSLPNGEDPAKLDMNEKFGLTLQKEQPLLVIPKRKL